MRYFSQIVVAGCLLLESCTASNTPPAEYTKPVAAVDPRAAALEWIDSVRRKIRGNVVLPQGTPANAQVVFAVKQKHDGEVVAVKLVSSSGFKLYDEATELAIWKSSPLPRPSQPGLFWPDLELRFRP